VDPAIEQALAEAVRRMADGRQERDRLIVMAHEQGASLRDIARVAELTHPGVLAIVRRAQGE
jgi:hypothetical protein